MKNLLVEEARALILNQAQPLAQEEVSLFEADGRVLGEMIDALRDQPPFAASAMDGWAIHEADARAPGAKLRIIGESAAGRPFDGKIGPGEAVRIFTGAAMPMGADAVVIQEDAEHHERQVTLKVASGPHAHTRSAGVDFKLSDQLLQPGARLDPWRIALAAAAGRGTLRVRRRPKVVLLSTGEEIVSAGAPPGKFQIFDSGGPALASLVRTWGGEPVRLAPARDEVAAIADAVRSSAGEVVVTIGGASVGDYDLVKPALAALGLELIFESVRMRPGKPTWFGRLADGRLVVGLPGNPSSALVCAQLFLRPLVMALQGADPGVRLIQAQTTTALPANGPRDHWMRAKLGHNGAVLTAEPMRDQDSSLVKVFAESDALLRRPIDAPAAEVQSLVEVLPLERLS